MKVAMISTYPPLQCGVGTYTSKLVYELRNLVEVKVIGPVGSNADIVVSEFMFRKHEGYADAICASISEVNPDIVHIQHEYGIWGYGEEFFNLLRCFKKHGIKVVVTMHSVDHALKGVRVVEYNRNVGKLVDKIIVHSELQEFELGMQGVDQRKVVVIPHGTDILPQIPVDEAKERIGISSEIRTFGYVGFIRKDKRLSDLVFALDLLKKRLKNVRLMIIGKPQRKKHEDYYYNELLPLIKSRDDVLHVNKFLSEEEFILYMSALDVVVFPYVELSKRLRYAVSGAFHHALSLSKAIVASRTPRLIEYINIAPEFTFVPGDYHALSEKVLKLLTNKELYDEIVSKIREYVRKTSWAAVAKKHSEVYREVIS